MVLDGRYRVAELIGIGGMGRVYRAEQVNVHGRDVAIKLLSASVANTAVVSQRFENEARIIAQLRHPNTLKIIDSGRFPDGRLYIVTEFLSGSPLEELYDHRPLGVFRTISIMKQVCASLYEAHELGIIHRDLKPSNIFVEQVAGQDVVKVLDFGLAKLVDVPGFTAPANICGTPGFMAPEQIAGQRVDPRCDIYALGTIIYECLTGQPPFTEASVYALMMKHMRDPPIPLSERGLKEPVDPELERMVMSMLAKVPADRPQSVADVQLVLEDVERRLLLERSLPHRIEGQADEGHARTSSSHRGWQGGAVGTIDDSGAETEAVTADLTPVKGLPSQDPVLAAQGDTPRDLPRETPVAADDLSTFRVENGKSRRAQPEDWEVRTAPSHRAEQPLSRIGDQAPFDAPTTRLSSTLPARHEADDGLITITDSIETPEGSDDLDTVALLGAPTPPAPPDTAPRAPIVPADTEPSQASASRAGPIPEAGTDPTAENPPASPGSDPGMTPRRSISVSGRAFSQHEILQPAVRSRDRRSVIGKRPSPMPWIVGTICALAIMLALAAWWVVGRSG
jgi:serine/threonine protein kinase